MTGFSEDPQLAHAQELAVREARIGGVIRPGSEPMRLAAEVIGAAPVERVDVLHGARWRTPCVRSGLPISAAAGGAVAGRGVPRPRPRDDLAGQVDAPGQPFRPVTRR